MWRGRHRAQPDHAVGADLPHAFFWDPSPDGTLNQSHGNTVDISTPLTGLLGGLYVSPAVHDNTFTGQCGGVFDLSPLGANLYVGEGCQRP